jgi:hypothetical protein
MIDAVLGDPLLVAMMAVAAGWVLAHAASTMRARPAHVCIGRRKLGIERSPVPTGVHLLERDCHDQNDSRARCG